MTTFKHAYNNPQTDDGDPNVTGPDEWNDDHVSDHAFVIMGSAPTNLTGTRSLAMSGLVSITDGGAGGNVTVGVSSAAVVAAVQAAGQALTKTNDTNVTLTLGGSPTVALLAATSMTLGWTGLLGLARGGTHTDLSATGGTAQYLKQASSGADITVGTIPASDIASGAALTRTNDTNVTLTLGGTPASALLAATSLTLGWTGLLGLARGGTHADLSATGGTGQYLKQASVGADITVGTIAAADLPGSFSGFANPSASIGLSAVNGSATTAMRSDAAPALSQAITPTWTGLHKWSATLGATPDDTAAGVQLVTSGTAAAGAQQYSPSIHWKGSGWKTTATAGAQAVDIRSYLIPVQGTANPSALIIWQFSVNAGSYVDMATISSAGVFNVVTGFQIGGAAASGNVLRGDGTNFVSAVLAASDIGSGQALTKTDDTNVTLTLGGTPATALLKAASLTLGWTGTLAVARGGIGVGTLAVNGVLYGNTTSAVQALAVNSTGTNKFLAQVSSGAPTWNTIAAGDLPANGANPTASVGLAAVNGSATTWMRSDAAPALSVAITPTWTGTHIWNAVPIRMGGTGAYLSIISTSAPTNVTSGDLSSTRLHVGVDVAQVSQVHVAANGNATMRLHGADSTNAGGVFSFISQHGTIALPTATVNGDHIGSLIWRGWDGTTQQATASITVLASDSYTSSVFGSEMAFSLVSHGTNSLVTRLNLVAGGSQAVGYLNVANTAAVPANTTGGDLTSIRYFNTGGRIDMLNATSNVISWSTVGVNVPGASSAGQKLQLYGTPGSPAASDYAIGIQSGAMWFSGATYIWYNSSGTAKTELVPGTALYHIGFLNVSSAIANPTNTTAGDITGVRGHFGVDSAFGANEVLTVNGGIFEAYYNGPLVLPAPPSGFGFAVTWNFSNGSGEVDLWNTWPGGSGTGPFYFNSLSGASYITHAVIGNGTIRSFLNGAQVLWAGNGTGSLQWGSWGYCGDATGTPSNVTPGDFTCSRLFAGSSISTSGTISGSTVLATTLLQSAVLGTFTHATGNYMIEYIGTGTGAITYGHYIDSSSQFHLDAVGIAQICLWTSAGDYQIIGANAYKASGTTWTPISDARVKHVEEDFTDGLEIVEQFRPKWWTFNDYAPISVVGERQMGLVAQEIEEITPYMVKTGSGKLGNEEIDDMRHYDAHAMDFLLVNAIKELSEQNKALLARLDALERRN